MVLLMVQRCWSGRSSSLQVSPEAAGGAVELDAMDTPWQIPATQVSLTVLGSLSVQVVAVVDRTLQLPPEQMILQKNTSPPSGQGDYGCAKAGGGGVE